MVRNWNAGSLHLVTDTDYRTGNCVGVANLARTITAQIGPQRVRGLQLAAGRTCDHGARFGGSFCHIMEFDGPGRETLENDTF